MKGSIKLLLKVIIVCMAVLMCFSHTVKAVELIKGISTAYCLKGITTSGEMTHEGVCAGSKKYLGKKIEIYQRLPDDSVGRYLGTYECKDTGKAKSIKKGYCIDVWKSNKRECQRWMDLIYTDGCKGRIYFKIVGK